MLRRGIELGSSAGGAGGLSRSTSTTLVALGDTTYPPVGNGLEPAGYIPRSDDVVLLEVAVVFHLILWMFGACSGGGLDVSGR